MEAVAELIKGLMESRNKWLAIGLASPTFGGDDGHPLDRIVREEIEIIDARLKPLEALLVTTVISADGTPQMYCSTGNRVYAGPVDREAAKRPVRHLWEITTGDWGDSFLRAYCWCETKETAEQMFRERNPGREIKEIADLMTSECPEFMTQLCDHGFNFEESS